MYRIYSNKQSVGKIWEAPRTKYDSDDTRIKKYACSRLSSFKMMDDRPVLEIVRDYKNLYLEILAMVLNICDIFQANCLPDKLSPSWLNYISTVKHKEKDLKHQELVAQLKT